MRVAVSACLPLVLVACLPSDPGPQAPSAYAPPPPAYGYGPYPYGAPQAPPVPGYGTAPYAQPPPAPYYGTVPYASQPPPAPYYGTAPYAPQPPPAPYHGTVPYPPQPPPAPYYGTAPYAPQPPAPPYANAPPPVPPVAPSPTPGDPYAAARQRCVDETNSYRAKLGVAPVASRPDKNACSDTDARGDAANGTIHGASGKCGLSAQNECPNWDGSGAGIVSSCLSMMFAEGPGEPYSAHGHYINMTNAEYHSLACGFYETGGHVWLVQNYFR